MNEFDVGRHVHWVVDRTTLIFQTFLRALVLFSFRDQFGASMSLSVNNKLCSFISSVMNSHMSLYCNLCVTPI